MNRYSIPPDTSDQEKIFGGLLSWYQVIWIGAGIIIGAVVGVLLFQVIGKLSIVLAVPLMGAGIPFAFVKKEELPLFEYIKRKKKHEKEQHLYPNRRQFK